MAGNGGVSGSSAATAASSRPRAARSVTHPEKRISPAHKTAVSRFVKFAPLRICRLLYAFILRGVLPQTLKPRLCAFEFLHQFRIFRALTAKKIAE
jgi:hypothetical protein